MRRIMVYLSDRHYRPRGNSSWAFCRPLAAAPACVLVKGTDIVRSNPRRPGAGRGIPGLVQDSKAVTTNSPPA